MASNQTPSMKHKVVSIDPSGQRREVPQPNQWQAEAEAKRRLARGHQNVEVQSWHNERKQFEFNPVANNHLIDEDKKVTVDEDALELLGKLSSSQRQMYKAASSGKATETEIENFVSELLSLARALAPETVSDYATSVR